jgi:HPt (histidine-containing phosphotransfer) domain-containing protein
MMGMTEPGEERMEPTEDGPTEPAVDLGVLRDAMDGDESLVREVTGLYVEDGARQLADLGDALRKRAVDDVRILAHGLKGASASIGAGPASRAFAEIESAAREGRLDAVPEALRRGRAEFERVRSFLQG